MNDPRYRGPMRPPAGNPSLRGFAREQRQREPEFEEEPRARPMRGPREPGGGLDRRPLWGSAAPPPAGRRPTRPPDEAGAPFGERPPRGPRGPGMNLARPGLPDAEMARAGRPPRRGEDREEWGAPRSGPDWEPGMRPRSGPNWGREPGQRPRSGPDWKREPPTRSGLDGDQESHPRRSPRRRSRPPEPATAADPRAKRRKIFRYLGLLGIMLFAGIAGICINYNLFLPALPLLLLALACAVVFVYF